MAEKEKVKVYCLTCGVFIKEIDKPFDPRDLGVPLTLSMWPDFDPTMRWCQACKDKNPPIPGRVTILP